MDIEKIIDKAIKLSKDGYPQDLLKLIKELEDEEEIYEDNNN